MNPQKYRITTRFQEKSRTFVWDGQSPLPLDSQFEWFLEKTSDSKFHLRSIKMKERKQSLLALSDAVLTGQAKIELPNQMSVEFFPLRQIPAPYQSIEISKQESSRSCLVAYSGSSRALLTSEVIHTAFVGMSRSKPVFTFQASSDGYQIRPLIPGVRLKLKGQKSITGEVGDTWKLTEEQLNSCTIARSNRWWKFNYIPWDEATAKPIASIRSQKNPETEFFKKISGVTILILSALSAFVYLLPQKEKIEEKKPEPPIVKFVMKKKKPVVVAAQKETAQKSLPRVESRKMNQVHSKVGSKVKSQEKIARSQLDSFRNALGGVLKLTNKSAPVVAQKAKPSTELFQSQSNTVQSTEIKPGYQGSQVKVAAGNANAYGTGEKLETGKAGKGGSFVSVKMEGVEVEKGLLLEEVGAVIHSHMDEVRYCHEAAMVSNPGVEGKVMIQFSIHPTGKVEKASLQSSTANDPKLEKCILSKLMRWQFPRPKGGIHVGVSYPFIFKVLARE